MLPNKSKFDYYDLNKVFSADELVNIKPDFISNGVSVDTRDIEKNNIFVALKGEKQDGHTRVPEAFEKGAIAAIVSRNWYEENKELVANNSLIVVEDTQSALGELASFHRERFDFPIIAIGGANGKTSTKEMTGYLLSKKYKVLKTFENFNNQLGLPLMLLQLDDSYQMAVLEIGTSEPGEIQILSKLLKPTSGLITNIGKEHLENLIDLDGVEMEETALFAHLLKRDGNAFINCDDERLKQYTRLLEESFTYGSDDECELSYDLKLDSDLTPRLLLKYKGEECQTILKVKGYTNANNAVAATAIALNHGLTLQEIAEYLSIYENDGSFSHSYGRMAVEDRGDYILINDCYNANPDSMLAAFANVQLIDKANSIKIAVLGDMKELGEAAEAEHIEILQQATKIFDAILTIGNDFLKAKNSIISEKILNFENHDLIIEHLKGLLSNNKQAVILVKGSRSMKMEKIIEQI